MRNIKNIRSNGRMRSLRKKKGDYEVGKNNGRGKKFIN